MQQLTIIFSISDWNPRTGTSEEVRLILHEAVGDEAGGRLGTRLAALFAGIGLDHDIEEMRGQEVRPAIFD